jgi:hypothetical protein
VILWVVMYKASVICTHNHIMQAPSACLLASKLLYSCLPLSCFGQVVLRWTELARRLQLLLPLLYSCCYAVMFVCTVPVPGLLTIASPTPMLRAGGCCRQLLDS